MEEKEPLNKTELIVHPIRLRIIEVVQGRQLTSQQIALLLPDVPQATLYRQIKRLAEGNILEVVEERLVNGIVERVYTMREGSAHITREEFAQISAEDHSRYFAIFLSTLTNRMNRYLSQEHFDVVREGMTYFKGTLHLTDEEAREFRVGLLEFVNGFALQKMAQEEPGRSARILGVAFIPEGANEIQKDEGEDAK